MNVLANARARMGRQMAQNGIGLPMRFEGGIKPQTGLSEHGLVAVKLS